MGPTYPRSANATVRRLARASSAPVTKTSTAGKAGFPGSWERKASIQMWQLQKVSKLSAKHGSVGCFLKIFIGFSWKLAESFLNSPQLTLLTPHQIFRDVGTAMPGGVGGSFPPAFPTWGWHCCSCKRAGRIRSSVAARRCGNMFKAPRCKQICTNEVLDNIAVPWIFWGAGGYVRVHKKKLETSRIIWCQYCLCLTKTT